MENRMNGLIKVLFVCVFLAMGVTAQAATINWQGDAGTDPLLWNDAENWDSGVAPTSDDVCQFKTPITATIDAAHTDAGMGKALGKRVNVGLFNNGILSMTGGEAEFLELSIGRNSGGDGEFYMSGGTLTITSSNNGFRIGQGVGAKGYMSMSGGLIDLASAGGTMVVGSGGLGQVFVSGGVIEVANLNVAGTGLMAINGGKLKIAGDQVALIDSLIASNDLVGYNGVGSIKRFYDGSEWTVVTAVPEPATMALLGLGGLLTIRRKK